MRSRRQIGEGVGSRSASSTAVAAPERRGIARLQGDRPVEALNCGTAPSQPLQDLRPVHPGLRETRVGGDRAIELVERELGATEPLLREADQIVRRRKFSHRPSRPCARARSRLRAGPAGSGWSPGRTVRQNSFSRAPGPARSVPRLRSVCRVDAGARLLASGMRISWADAASGNLCERRDRTLSRSRRAVSTNRGAEIFRAFVPPEQRCGPSRHFFSFRRADLEHRGRARSGLVVAASRWPPAIATCAPCQGENPRAYRPCRRGGRVAEGGGLLNRYTGKPVSWVRIPSSPPAPSLGHGATRICHRSGRRKRGAPPKLRLVRQRESRKRSVRSVDNRLADVPAGCGRITVSARAAWRSPQSRLRSALDRTSKIFSNRLIIKNVLRLCETSIRRSPSGHSRSAKCRVPFVQHPPENAFSRPVTRPFFVVCAESHR